MSNAKLYYTPPTDAQFEEVKEKSIEVWNTMDNTYKYVDGKIARIKDIKNVEDNFMYMVAMFDSNNQSKLASKLSAETRQAIRDRMIDGGQPEFLIVF